MRSPRLAALGAALLIPAAPAYAGDPIMPLSDVRPGMQCTGHSVVRGTEIASFAVEVIDVVDERATGGGPRILFRVSGPAIDETGLGPGFSGSPIYCPDAGGVARNIGAISEAIGEYGGKVALATPIEAILGEPVDAPRARPAPPGARPLTSPLTVSGLTPRLGAAIEQAAAARGELVLAAPVGPLGSFPVQPMVPGASLGVGYASGDVSLGAVGVVAYADGDRVWGFGHPLDGVGARALLMQDAYVFRVINNPIGASAFQSTYKFAAAGHDVGTIGNDALSAVVGRVGGLPPTVPVRITATDADTGTERSVVTNVADESGIDEPTGSSILGFVAPIAVAQAAGTVLGGTPARVTGRACFSIALRELREPVRFCNRYVSEIPDLLGAGSVPASAAASDLLKALELIDGYKASRVHVKSVDGRIRIGRGRHQAFLRRVELPSRVKAGRRKVPATVTLRHVRGRLERRRVEVKLPRLRPGIRQVVFTGTGLDLGDADLLDLLGFDVEEAGGSEGFGPPNLRRLAAAIEKVGRYDGVSARRPGQDADSRTRSFRDPDVRISGRVRATVRVRR